MTISAPGPATVRSVRIVIADDDSDVRTALIDLISDDETLEVVGVAVDADGAAGLAASLCPDVALVDVRMPGSGLHAAREIRRLSPATVVIALSSYGDRRTVAAMTEAGAAHFVVKGAPGSDLLATIAEAVAAP